MWLNLKKNQYILIVIIFIQILIIKFRFIVFDKKKLSDVSRCKEKMNEWNAYFENFDIQRTTNENQSLSTFYTDNPHQKPLEIVAKDIFKDLTDIESSFILKFYKHI